MRIRFKDVQSGMWLTFESSTSVGRQYPKKFIVIMQVGEEGTIADGRGLQVPYKPLQRIGGGYITIRGFTQGGKPIEVNVREDEWVTVRRE